MSRNDKLAKLRNAIMAYRGIKNSATGKWHRPPCIGAKLAVQKWLRELDLDPEQTLTVIDGFKHINQFHGWISSL